MIRQLQVIALAVALANVGAPSWASEPSDWGAKDRIWSYVGSASRPSDDECLGVLYANAVKAATGRFYFGEEMFIARELMEKYIDREAARFIAAHDELERRQAGSTIHLRARVNVQIDRLFNSLKQMRFPYVPKSNPAFSVFMRETIEGSLLDESLSRGRIHEILAERGLSLGEHPLPEPAASIDVSVEPALLSVARREAQKHGVEILLSGTISTHQIEDKAQYFSRQRFYQTVLSLHLIRVDDGRILKSVENLRVREAHTQGADAIKKAIMVATDQATNELIEYFSAHWAKSFHEAADYRVMLTDISAEDLMTFTESLSALDESIRVYPRNYFGRVAVLNFDYGGDEKILTSFFANASHPQFRIIPRGERRFEFEIVNR